LEKLDMTGRRIARRVKLAALSSLLAGGTLLGSACTARDIEHNLVAGSLAYVRGGATSFWNAFLPQDELWQGFFNPSPTLFPQE
jgi:hypothetical protein